MTPPIGRRECWDFCRHVLPDVSRSFALIIPLCPPPIDRALCIAYLLCRIADTIEDSAGIADERKATLYDEFLSALDTGDTEAFLGDWPEVPEDDYSELMRGTAKVIGAFHVLPGNLRPPIHACVRDMIAGMRAVRPVETRAGIRFYCRDLDDLDRYCHHVAGTVGIMSTALFETRLGAAGFLPTDHWREQGRRLGLGLQMTNIIKDCRVDAERGVSFIPARFVDLEGGYRLAPGTRPALMAHAIAHLDEGMSYVLAVPPSETGLRTFLLGSLLPAIATLERAAAGTEHHPKIDRAKMTEIFDLIARQVTRDDALQAWYTAHRTKSQQTP